MRSNTALRDDGMRSEGIRGWIMHKLLIVLCIAAAFILFVGCASWQETAEIHCVSCADCRQVHDLIVLPFYEDTFFLTLSEFEAGYSPIGSGFRFDREGEERFDPRTGIHWSTMYDGADFCSRAAEFINLLNSLSPVLVSAIITDRAKEADDNPFKGIERDNSLYSIVFNSIPNWTYAPEMDEYRSFHFRMVVYETAACGLLHFFMFGNRYIQYPTHTHSFMSDRVHHSLYRISLDELDEIIQFAESLERARLEWHGHGLPLLAQLKQFLIPVVIGVGIAVAIILVVRKVRKKKSTTSDTQ